LGGVTVNKLNRCLAVALVGLTAASVLVLLPAKTLADPRSNAIASKLCRENNDLGLTHGQCTSLTEALINADFQRGNSDALYVCKDLRDAGLDFPLGQCVKIVNQN